LIHSPASENKKAINAAMSSGLPNRCDGIFGKHFFTLCLGHRPQQDFGQNGTGRDGVTTYALFAAYICGMPREGNVRFSPGEGGARGEQFN
jgi:hypothetical protein